MNTRRARIDDSAEACLIIRRSISELCSLDHDGDEKLLAQWLSNTTVDNVRKWILRWHFFVRRKPGQCWAWALSMLLGRRASLRRPSRAKRLAQPLSKG